MVSKPDWTPEPTFDMKAEQLKGNRFWKQGKGREEHRAMEVQAK